MLTVRGMARIGERIRIAREAKELSQEALGACFNITREAVSAWETQGAQPALEKLPKLSIILEVSLLWLLTGEGAMREGELGLLNDFDRKLVRCGRHIAPQDRDMVLSLVERFTKS